MTANQLKLDYQAFWEKYKTTVLNVKTDKHDDLLYDRGFAFQFDEEIRKPDILFLGINPSYIDNLQNGNNFYVKHEVTDYPYFKPFKRIQESLVEKYSREIEWTHIDLLVFRETNQSFIKKKLIPKKTHLGNEFIIDQLTIARRILEHIQPKIIVVSNTMAKELLGRNRGKHEKTQEESGVWMGLNFEFNEATGTDKIINSGKLDGTHVFFTSMLSGQRALDNGSRERLVWHINEVLKKQHEH